MTMPCEFCNTPMKQVEARVLEGTKYLIYSCEKCQRKVVKRAD
jgi:ribosomal protein L37AE/L43A